MLHEFADDAHVLVDLHGGDLCEQVSRFTIAQQIGDAAFDAENLALARCSTRRSSFASARDTLLPPGEAPLAVPASAATPPSPRPAASASSRRRTCAFTSRAYCASPFTSAWSTPRRPSPERRSWPTVTYVWVNAPTDGIYRYRVEPGQRVVAGATLATVEDAFGRRIATVTAPESH